MMNRYHFYLSSSLFLTILGQILSGLYNYFFIIMIIIGVVLTCWSWVKFSDSKITSRKNTKVSG